MRTIATAALGLALAIPALAADKPPTTWKGAYSGNYTSSSLSRGIEYVVIHTVEGSALGAVSWFNNPSAQVSAHYVVGFAGEIYQCVADKDIGWHAGNWTYNQHSIGIEHAGYTYQNQWTEAQYQASAALTRWICLTYGVPMDRDHIIGHVEVPGATHTDPGPYFDWNHYMDLVTNGSSAPPPPPSGTPISPKPVKVTTSSLNVRSGPDTTYSIVGTIPQGQTYVAFEQSGSWYRIWWAGNSAWIYAGYTEAATGTAVKVSIASLNVRSGPDTTYTIMGTAHSPEMYWRVSTSGAWSQICFGGAARWVYSDYTTPVSFGGSPAPTPLPKIMKITAASLNVRSGPGTTYSILGTIPNGQRYVAIAQSGEWFKIHFAGNVGWCHSSYLAPVTGTGAKVTVSLLNVRSGPGTGYSIVGTAHSPETYVRIATSGSWTQVYFGGASRWIYTPYTSSVAFN